MNPPKKKKRQFRQAFARFLQHITPGKSGNATFSGPLNSIAILAQEKLGDCVLLTSLIRTLRRTYPSLEICIVTFSRASADFFENDPDVTSVYQVKKHPGGYIRNVLSRKFDLLFNTKDHPSTHFLLQSVLIRARFKVGHDKVYHQGLFDSLITMDYLTHMSLKNCALLDVLGITCSEEECRPSLAHQPLSAELQHFIRQLDKKQVTGINISAGETNRTWPEMKWIELLGRFPDRNFIILSGPGDTAKKNNIERNCPNILVSPSTKNLYEVRCIVENLDMLVTSDTSLIHIASATKTPVIGLYRNALQDISRFGPFRIPNELVISTSGEVSDIEPETIALALKKLAIALIGKQW